jgi:hypothetical protein
VVRFVGQVETRRQFIDTARTYHSERRRSSRDPALHVEFAESTDVIRMQMRDEDGAGRRERQTPEHQVLRRLRADVDQIERTAGLHGDARLRPIPDGEGP